MKFHYTDPEMFFKDKSNITVKEIRQLLYSMTHCTSSCYHNERFCKAMYELCPESYDTVKEFLRGCSRMPQMPADIVLQELMRCKEFVNSVGCLIDEGLKFMPKEQLYVAIKNEYNRIILKQGERQ